jgi:UDP-N-acetylglucosamine--N-acetylmuramyl-(pentapeptide) pyrophosphoryl-undecaprenol N-acetylglucosamine transferase
VKEGLTLAFTGGGTGGHVYPGLAIIEELRKGFDGRIVWIGGSREFDRRTVESAGIEYLTIPSGKLRRRLSLKNVADAFRVFSGFFAARRILADLRPALLFSKGGYVSVPPCRAAASLGIPVFTHESDFSPGLATRVNARTAEKILLAYEATREALPPSLRSKAIVVGNPVRAAIRRGSSEAGRRALGLDAETPVVLVLGGSQGAVQVNEILAGALSYIGDQLPDLMAAATIIVSRAGAGSLWEAATLGKPLVLIPLSGKGTRGDQVDNARHFAAAGAAKVLLGVEANSASLTQAVLGWLDDPASREAAGAASRAIAQVDGATAVAALILERTGAQA